MPSERPVEPKPVHRGLQDVREQVRASGQKGATTDGQSLMILASRLQHLQVHPAPVADEKGMAKAIEAIAAGPDGTHAILMCVNGHYMACLVHKRPGELAAHLVDTNAVDRDKKVEKESRRGALWARRGALSLLENTPALTRVSVSRGNLQHGRAGNACGPLSLAFLEQVNDRIGRSPGATIDPPALAADFFKEFSSLQVGELTSRIGALRGRIVAAGEEALEQLLPRSPVVSPTGGLGASGRTQPSARSARRQPAALEGRALPQGTETIGGMRFNGLAKNQLSHPVTRALGKVRAMEVGLGCLAGLAIAVFVPPLGIGVVMVSVATGVAGVFARAKQRWNVSKAPVAD